MLKFECLLFEEVVIVLMMFFIVYYVFVEFVWLCCGECVFVYGGVGGVGIVVI